MKKYNGYQESDPSSSNLDDKFNIAYDMIEALQGTQHQVEKNPDTLKEIIDMDLRENVPPQIYEVISSIVDVIIKVENE